MMDTEAVTPPTQLHNIGTPRPRTFETPSRTAVRCCNREYVTRADLPGNPTDSEEADDTPESPKQCPAK